MEAQKAPVSYLIAKKMSGTFISKCVRLAIQDLPAGVDALLSKSVIAWVLIGDWFHGWISSWQTPVTTRKRRTERDDDRQNCHHDA
jgi:hypothetical protein